MAASASARGTTNRREIGIGSPGVPHAPIAKGGPPGHPLKTCILPICHTAEKTFRFMHMLSCFHYTPTGSSLRQPHHVAERLFLLRLALQAGEHLDVLQLPLDLARAHFR